MTFLIKTLGCKVNQHESAGLAAFFCARGHVPAATDSVPDVCVVNTCAVTAESARKSRQAVRLLKKRYPGAIIGVAGCLSAIDPAIITELGADVIGGAGGRIAFAEEIEQRTCRGGLQPPAIDPETEPQVTNKNKFEVLPAPDNAGRARALLKIQDGCDNFCAYCIIPYARGRARSLPPAEVAREAAVLDHQGYREIVITGIEISSYGRDLPGDVGLSDALRVIAEAAPNSRLHLGSLEPRVVTDDFCETLLALPRVCDHFHLSLQSGCDETLRRMNRKYDTRRFRDAVLCLRAAFPECGLTTDLIAGFPGETDEEFSETLRFISECGFSAMHIFPFSARKGTAAYNLPDQIEKSVRQSRAKAAAVLAAGMKQRYLKTQLGRTVEVLFETIKDGVSHGHAANYCEVSVKGAVPHGAIANVRIDRIEGALLLGTITI